MPCKVPVIGGFPDGSGDPDSRDKTLTYGDVVEYSIELMGTVESCNEQLKQIKELNEITITN